MRSCLDCGALYDYAGYRCTNCQRAKTKRRDAEPNRVKRREAWYLALRPQGVCYICHAAPATTRDHVVPLNRGGEHSPTNIKFACLPCNSRKRDN